MARAFVPCVLAPCLPGGAGAVLALLGERYSVGAPPAGRVAPARGFGWLWGRNPQLALDLGWGLEQEKGFCARIQYFERGFALRNVTGSCSSEFNRANEGDFSAVFFLRIQALGPSGRGR